MNGRNYALTFSCKYYSQNDVLEIFNNIDFAELRGYTIGFLESGEVNDYKHFHCLLVFKNKVSFDTIQEFFKNVHIERVVKYKDYRNYMKKDGPYFDDTLGNYDESEVYFNDLYNSNTIVDFFRIHPNLISKFNQFNSLWLEIQRLKGKEVNNENNNFRY